MFWLIDYHRPKTGSKFQVVRWLSEDGVCGDSVSGWICILKKRLKESEVDDIIIKMAKEP